MTFVVVTGQPGAGKTTVARLLATRLGLTLLSKDTIKEALSVLDDPESISVARSKRLGVASFAVLFAIAESSEAAVLEASWNPSLDAERLSALPSGVIEVHCRCPAAVARSRYAERIPERHWVHVDDRRVHDDDLWAASPEPHGLSEPVVQVDTTRSLDIERISQEIRRHPTWVPGHRTG